MYNALGQVFQIKGPTNLLELCDPAGKGHVAYVAAGMDDFGVGEERGDPAELAVIVRHLVGHTVALVVAGFAAPL